VCPILPPADVTALLDVGLKAVDYDATRAFRVLVTGSREWVDIVSPRVVLFHVLFVVTQGQRPAALPVLFHGGARGLDRIAAAIWGNWHYPLRPFLVTQSEWSTQGKRAGHLRNGKMVAARPDVCLAFPIRKSPGTRNCIAQAEAAGIPTITIEGR
jgi:catechol 2,3-dioxygenase-like lactoylglutathione lyase family enzyme